MRSVILCVSFSGIHGPERASPCPGLVADSLSQSPFQPCIMSCSCFNIYFQFIYYICMILKQKNRHTLIIISKIYISLYQLFKYVSLGNSGPWLHRKTQWCGRGHIRLEPTLHPRPAPTGRVGPPDAWEDLRALWIRVATTNRAPQMLPAVPSLLNRCQEGDAGAGRLRACRECRVGTVSVSENNGWWWMKEEEDFILH